MLLHGKRIFIVEDNLQNRIVYMMTLKIQGAEIEFERWGRDAMWRLRGMSQVDLIILDLMLHDGVTGYNIFDEIRKLPNYDSVPIIAVSASEPAVAIPKTQEKGFAGFIAKPVDDILFPQQIAAVLNGEQVWSAGGRYADINY